MSIVNRYDLHLPFPISICLCFNQVSWYIYIYIYIWHYIAFCFGIVFVLVHCQLALDTYQSWNHCLQTAIFSLVYNWIGSGPVTEPRMIWLNGKIRTNVRMGCLFVGYVLYELYGWVSIWCSSHWGTDYSRCRLLWWFMLKCYCTRIFSLQGLPFSDMDYLYSPHG